MNHLLAPLLIASATGIVSGVDLGPETHISLASALAVGAVVLSGAWWVGRYMQRLDDRMEAGGVQMQQLSDRIAQIERKCGSCLDSQTNK